MKKIKIVGALVFVLSVTLAFLSSSISHKNSINGKILDTINDQKAFTQEISKNIFFIYKNKDFASSQLDDSINSFIHNMNAKNDKFKKIESIKIQEQSAKIVLLWNKFYLDVQKFRDKSKITTAYSSIILEDVVKDIYNINLKLVVEFDKLKKLHQEYFNTLQKNNKILQYTLFALLIFLLIYLFTQVKTVISFMQKFLSTSKNIIKSSSIKELEYIEVEKSSDEVSQATSNFNFLVQKINNSIEFSSKSIENSYKSLEVCEDNIEEMLELLVQMQENENLDKELTKKEDALILSLEELSRSSLNLKNLKSDLNSLVTSKKV